VKPEGESENLREMEEHAAEAKSDQGENADPATDSQGAEDSGAQGAGSAGANDAGADNEEGSDSEYGVENDMRPGGPAAGEADTDGPTKSINEDVTGDEETEHMSELHTDD